MCSETWDPRLPDFGRSTQSTLCTADFDGLYGILVHHHLRELLLMLLGAVNQRSKPLMSPG